MYKALIALLKCVSPKAQQMSCQTLRIVQVSLQLICVQPSDCLGVVGVITLKSPHHVLLDHTGLPCLVQKLTQGRKLNCY